jgi:hypothetical protein
MHSLLKPSLQLSTICFKLESSPSPITSNILTDKRKYTNLAYKCWSPVKICVYL